MPALERYTEFASRYLKPLALLHYLLWLDYRAVTIIEPITVWHKIAQVSIYIRNYIAIFFLLLILMQMQMSSTHTTAERIETNTVDNAPMKRNKMEKSLQRE